MAERLNEMLDGDYQKTDAAARLLPPWCSGAILVGCGLAVGSSFALWVARGPGGYAFTVPVACCAGVVITLGIASRWFQEWARVAACVVALVAIFAVIVVFENDKAYAI